MKRKYANVGEKIRLVNPMAFVRCGYPLCSGVIDKRDDLRKRKWEMINAAGAALFPESPRLRFAIPVLALGDTFSVERTDDALHIDIDGRVASKLEAAVNMAILIQEGFGGNERSVFEEKGEGVFAGSVFEVTKKRFVKTGTRFNGSGRWSHDGDYDYDPPGLSDEQTHCVYELDGWFQTLAKNTERL